MQDMLEKAKAQLLADKRRSGLLIGLVAVGLLFWGRLMLKETPKTATAEPVAAAASASGSDGAPAPVARAAPLPAVVLTGAAVMPRDPFRFDASGYAAAPGQGPLEEAQDGPKTADPHADREARRAAVVAQARKLTLDSVIKGSRPRVMISGQMLEPGQQVEGFVLLKIDSRQVVLEKEGVRVLLKM